MASGAPPGTVLTLATVVVGRVKGTSPDGSGVGVAGLTRMPSDVGRVGVAEGSCSTSDSSISSSVLCVGRVGVDDDDDEDGAGVSTTTEDDVEVGAAAEVEELSTSTGNLGVGSAGGNRILTPGRLSCLFIQKLVGAIVK